MDGDKSKEYEITLSYSPGNGREKETQEYAGRARNSILEGGYCLQSCQCLPLLFALIHSPSPASLNLSPILYNLKMWSRVILQKCHISWDKWENDVSSVWQHEQRCHWKWLEGNAVESNVINEHSFSTVSEREEKNSWPDKEPKMEIL